MQPSPVFIPEAALINPYTIKEGIKKRVVVPDYARWSQFPLADGWLIHGLGRLDIPLLLCISSNKVHFLVYHRKYEKACLSIFNQQFNDN